jgi:hypothetical protein
VIMQHHVRFDMHACDRSVGRVRPANAPCAADLHVMSRERLGLDATAKKRSAPQNGKSLEKMWMNLEETGGQCDMSVKDVMTRPRPGLISYAHEDIRV